MRLCANENLPEDCVAKLRVEGHDVLWIRESAPGSPDTDVLARAFAESRLLITFDISANRFSAVGQKHPMASFFSVSRNLQRQPSPKRWRTRCVRAMIGLATSASWRNSLFA